MLDFGVLRLYIFSTCVEAQWFGFHRIFSSCATFLLCSVYAGYPRRYGTDPEYVDTRHLLAIAHVNPFGTARLFGRRLRFHSRRSYSAPCATFTVPTPVRSGAAEF